MAEDARGLRRRHLIFYLEVFDDTSGTLLGHLVDITTKGIKLVSKEPIAVGKSFTMRMRLPEDRFEGRTLCFQGTSRWSSNDVNPDFYDTGFQTEGLDRDTVDTIHDLIESLGFSDAQ